MIHWRIFGFTVKAYHKRDFYGFKEVQALVKASEGKDRYIKTLEMSLDRKNEEMTRLRARSAYSLAYSPKMAAAAPADSPLCMCEVCEKPVSTLFTLDPDYPHGQAYCQGHPEP